MFVIPSGKSISKRNKRCFFCASELKKMHEGHDRIDFVLLQKSLKANNVAEVKRHVTRHNVNDVDEDGVSAVGYVCMPDAIGDDTADLIKYFVHLGMQRNNIENVTRTYWCPIHRAASNGKKEIVRALVQSGVSVDFIDAGRTPLCHLFAERHSNTLSRKMIIFLLDLGADPLLARFVQDPITLPQYAYDFIQHRGETRLATIIVLGLRRTSKSVLESGNGKDVLCLIARCLWSLRGVVEMGNATF